MNASQELVSQALLPPDSFHLKVCKLSKSFGERTVIDIENLIFESPHIYALIGPNGSGKSTLLRILAGTIDQTSGYIDVEGSRSRQDIAVGYMPQKSYVFGFSVFENVALALKSQRLSKAELEDRVNAALKAVGMIDLAQERGSGLSGGEAQRVALARMLVRDLDVLLLDEPTASMDITGTLLIEEALLKYQEDRGGLIIIATHAPSQARRISGRAVMLHAGKALESGTTEDVLDHPQTEEGKNFLSYWKV